MNPNVRVTRCPSCQSWECGTVCRFLEGVDWKAFNEEYEARMYPDEQFPKPARYETPEP
jgi:hypothetical protein